MAASCDSSSPSSMSSVSPPRPKSPPGYPDLYGKRRQLAKVQLLQREIGMLEEELKSLESLQRASGCCKELDDFIAARQDPLISINQNARRSDNFWKRLWEKHSYKFSWMCCFCQCDPRLRAICCPCYLSNESHSPGSTSMETKSCLERCNWLDLSCSCCSCSRFGSFFPKFAKFKFCSNC